MRSVKVKRAGERGFPLSRFSLHGCNLIVRKLRHRWRRGTASAAELTAGVREETAISRRESGSTYGKEEGAARRSINADFKDDVEAWDGTARKVFTLGNTSEALQSIGVRERVIKWTSDAMAHSMKHRGMTIDIVKQVPEILEKPVVVMQSRTVPDRITMFADVADANGAPVIAILEINPKNKDGSIEDINILNNAYGKDRGIMNFMKNSKYLYLDPQKNRTDTWLQRLGLQLPLDETMYGSIGRISYADGEVNIHAVPWKKIFGAVKETKRTEVGTAKRSREYIDYNDQEKCAAAVQKAFERVRAQGNIVTLDSKKISTQQNAADWQNISAARTYVKTLFKEIMGDSVYFDDRDVFVEAYFTKNAKNHFTGDVSPEKAAMVSDFNGIVQNSVYAYSSEHDMHGSASRKGIAKFWDCFVGGVRIGETESPVVFYIRHMPYDTRAQVYTIKEETALHDSVTGLNLQRHSDYEGITASKDNVSQAEKEVKRKNSIERTRQTEETEAHLRRVNTELQWAVQYCFLR